MFIVMGAPSKRARKIRNASEFNSAKLQAQLTPPKQNVGAVAWTLTEIFSARDAQMRGQFRMAARLAEAMRTDDALAVAYENRLAPQRCIPVQLKSAKGARGESVKNEAEALFGEAGVGIHPDTKADINGCFVNHGVAFGVNVWTPREDGTRVDVEHRYWPIEFVRWDSYKQCYVTQTEEGQEEEIVHGDGRWVVYKKHEHEPWKQEAAILPAAAVWARHAFAARDWAKGSVAHGNAKVVGEMPEGVPLQDADGNLTSEAAAMLALVQAVASADSPAGIRPAGAKIDYLTNNSTAWQVWAELIANAEKAAARIYLGTDGVLGSQGGAPGVDIQALFGVATTRVQGDLGCIERALLTGVIEPWTAINFGDSALAPQYQYQIPDADEDAQRASFATRNQAFLADIKAAKDAGLALTDEYIEALAEKHGVPALKLAPAPAAPAAAPAPAALRRV